MDTNYYIIKIISIVSWKDFSKCMASNYWALALNSRWPHIFSINRIRKQKISAGLQTKEQRDSVSMQRTGYYWFVQCTRVFKTDHESRGSAPERRAGKKWVKRERAAIELRRMVGREGKRKKEKKKIVLANHEENRILKLKGAQTPTTHSSRASAINLSSGTASGTRTPGEKN